VSISILIYLGAVAVLWPACMFAVRRVSGQGLVDRLAAGLITAMAWPVTVPVLGIAAVRRGHERRPQLELVPDGLEALAIDVPAPTTVAVNS
jgi:hypothetical protein